jgi:hypothetical protein
MITAASDGEIDKAGKVEVTQATASPEIQKSEDAASAMRMPDTSFFKRATQYFVNAIAARPRLSRVTILTVAIAISAALGSMVGAWAAVTLVRPSPPPVPTVIANADSSIVAQLSADIAALQASVEAMTRNSGAQLARINERVERNDPTAKIAKLADAVEKLERNAAAVPLPVPAPVAAAPEITGSIVPKQRDKSSVVSGWVLREVFDGAAMVESRHGLYEVVPGANLPGLGRVETIRRYEGRWVVVTPKGMIVSSR